MSAERIRLLLDDCLAAWAAGRVADARLALDEALRLDPGDPAARELAARLFGPAAAPASGPGEGADPGAAQRPWGFDGPTWEFPADREDAATPLDWDVDVDTDPLPDAEVAWHHAALELPDGPQAPALELLSDAPAPPPPGPGAAPATRAAEVARLLEGARELHDLADFTGSLELVEKVLAIDPRNAEALDHLRRNEGTLVQMYESKLGPLDRTPRVGLNPDEVVWLNLDHRAGFVLAQIDGAVTFEDVFALSGMSRLDTCRILVQLLEEGVIRAA